MSASVSNALSGLRGLPNAIAASRNGRRTCYKDESLMSFLASYLSFEASSSSSSSLPPSSRRSAEQVGFPSDVNSLPYSTRFNFRSIFYPLSLSFRIPSVVNFVPYSIRCKFRSTFYPL